MPLRDKLLRLLGPPSEELLHEWLGEREWEGGTRGFLLSHAVLLSILRTFEAGLEMEREAFSALSFFDQVSAVGKFLTEIGEYEPAEED